MRRTPYEFVLSVSYKWEEGMIMRIALYARVSTRDKDQNPETQLLRLREFVSQHADWQVTHTYIDQASANDLLHRIGWKRVQDAAVKRQFDAVLVFKLDRAFRSVKHMHDTLAIWDALPVGFLSAQEGFDTTTALGRLLLNLLASLAEFELEIIRERVKAGMDRAKQEGKAIGRPPITTHPEKWARVQAAVAAVEAGDLSYRKAAQQFGVSVSTIQRSQQILARQCTQNGGPG